MILNEDDIHLKNQVQRLELKLIDLVAKLVAFEALAAQLEKQSKIAMWVCFFVVLIAIISVFGLTFMRLAYHLSTGK